MPKILTSPTKNAREVVNPMQFRHPERSYVYLERVSGDFYKRSDIFTPFRSKLKKRLMQAFYFQPVSVVVEHLAKLGRHLTRFHSFQDGGW